MQEIPRSAVLDKLRAENPWWQPPHRVPAPEAALRPRAYLKPFLSLVKAWEVRRAILLMGPRRVGKTVLLLHTVRQLLEEGVAPHHLCYVSVDLPTYNGLGLEALVNACREAAAVAPDADGVYLFFDEIQHLREWEVHLKTLVDTLRGVRVVVSGSAAAALKRKSHESGAGRFTDFLLPPLTFQEYVELRLGDSVSELSHLATILKDIALLNREFVSYLNFGGYPEVALNESVQKSPDRFVKEDVIDKVLLRDLPSLYGIQDVQELNSLFTVLAFNTGSEVSLEALSKRSHVAKNTLKRYIEYLEAAFLIKVVHRVDHTARRFQRANTFKVYLTNPSMFAALFTPVTADDEATRRLVETAVFAQWFHSAVPIHYARWEGGEVDLVWLDSLQKPINAAEVKWSDRLVSDAGELRPLVSFCRRHRVPGLALTRSSSGTKKTGDVEINYLPASGYCYIIGIQLIGDRTEAVHQTIRSMIGPSLTAESD